MTPQARAQRILENQSLGFHGGCGSMEDYIATEIEEAIQERYCEIAARRLASGESSAPTPESTAGASGSSDPKSCLRRG